MKRAITEKKRKKKKNKNKTHLFEASVVAKVITKKDFPSPTRLPVKRPEIAFVSRDVLTQRKYTGNNTEREMRS